MLVELDRIDPYRDILAGADLGVRNQLDAKLHRLEANVIVTCRKFNETRDEVLEAYFGTDLYCHLKLDRVADQGQQYCFLPSNQRPAPSMLTALERRETTLPLYERDLVPDPYPALPQGSADCPPDYRDLCPYNSLDEFQPLDHECNDEAVSEGASSASSDDHGQGMTRIEVLRRLRRKLRSELVESKEVEKAHSKVRTDDLPIAFAPAQQAEHGTLKFGYTQERKDRCQQLRKQIQLLTIFLSEELRLVNCHEEVIRLRSAVMNGEAKERARFSDARQALQLAVRQILHNRINHSLSELLVPLNGTDTSKCHAINVLPESHRAMFAPRVMGFPASMAANQLDSYSSAPGHLWWDGDEDSPEVNEDLGEDGNDQLSSSEASDEATTSGWLSTPFSTGRIPQTPAAQGTGYLPVTTFKRFGVEEDKWAPKVRVLRLPRQGIVFEVVMPQDPPRRSTPDAPEESARLSAITNERLSLVALVEAAGCRLEGADSSNVNDLPVIVASASPPNRVRLTLDMSSVDRDGELSRMVRAVQSRGPFSSSDTDEISSLEEVVQLALGLDGQLAHSRSPRILRLRQLVTEYLPDSHEHPRASISEAANAVQIAMMDDPLLDARVRRAERNIMREVQAENLEAARRLLQSASSDDNDDAFSEDDNGSSDSDDDESSDGGMEIRWN